MPLADAFLNEIDQEARTTQRVLERVPEDKLTWKPHPKSHTLGQLAMHVAVAQGFLAGAAAQDVFKFEGRQPAQPKTKKEILDAFANSTAAAKENLKKLDDARLLSEWQGEVNGKKVLSMPRVAFVRAIVMNHTYHHRGQLSVYLRLLEVPVPSIYGPSADENPFA